jgi:hypothetical protein
MFRGKTCFLMSLSRKMSFRNRRQEYTNFNFLHHTQFSRLPLLTCENVWCHSCPTGDMWWYYKNAILFDLRFHVLVFCQIFDL